MDAATMMAQAMREAAWEHNAYKPLPHDAGPVCETAWLTLPFPRFPRVASWADYNELIQPCDDDCGCTHGGAS